MMKAIAYCRVSTTRQEHSGLSIEAQLKTIDDYIKTNEIMLLDVYMETDAGWRNDRIGLQAALADCDRLGAILLIPKLDRLSRNVAFIATLLESSVTFLFLESPHASIFELHIRAAVAEHEGKMIRERTRAALAAAKKRGVELGWFGKYVTSKFNQFHAEMFACRMKPVIADIRARGIKTVRAIVAELNRLKIPTYQKQGHKWHLNTVYKLLKRLHPKE